MSCIGAIPDFNSNTNKTNNEKPSVKVSSKQPLFNANTDNKTPTKPTETQIPTANKTDSNPTAKQNTNRAEMNAKKIQEVKDLKEKAKILNEQTKTSQEENLQENEGASSDVIVAGEEEVPL